MPKRGNDIIVGTSSDGKPIYLCDMDRLGHLLVLGVTGTGKSCYLQEVIRQDLRLWPSRRCGMLIIDPHGEMFDGLMAWVAANRLTSLPIVPIDFRRTDQIISYNPLRHRSAEPSVIIDAIVQGMAHVWGQGSTDETPLFERWATNTLHRLYNENKTLAEAAHIFTPEGMVDVNEIEDPLIRQDWIWARRNRKDFETVTSSSINRFRRFLLNPNLRAIFGQSEVSLDLGRALDDGQIVLMSLARNGGHLSRENADLFATLLLSDLQVAADERGKGNVKPFYTYIDEFWRFLTPTTAENLAESRGFGIGMTMATQFPRQILNGSRHGPRIFDEVMENARNKVVFRMRSLANLEPIAETLFWDSFDPEQIKYQHYSVKVIGQEVKYLPSVGFGANGSHGASQQSSRTRGKAHARGRNWLHTDSHSRSTTLGHTVTNSTTESAGDQWNDAETRQYDPDSSDPDRISRSGGRGGNSSLSTTGGTTDSFNETESEGEADSFGGNETDTTSEADTEGQGTNWSHGFSSSFTLSPMLFSVFSNEPDQPVFRSIDEQIFIAMAKIARLKNREAYVLVGSMETPALIRTPDINLPDISRTCTALCVGWYQRESGLALPLDEALARVASLDRNFYVVTVIPGVDEIDRPRRRIVLTPIGQENAEQFPA